MRDIAKRIPDKCKSLSEKNPKMGTGILGNVKEITAKVKLVKTVTPCKGMFGL